MNIAKISVNRPVAVTMRIAALTLLGAVCLGKLSVDLLPKVSIPTVAVVTNWPNTAPEQMETQVTRPIEEAVSQVQGIYHVSSSSTTGSSSVRVQFNWGTNIDAAAVDTLQLVQRARSSLPNDPNIQQPIVFKYDPSTLPILILGASGISDPIKLRTILDNEVTPLLESADGVASVTTSGGLQRAIIVDVDPKKLQAYKVGITDIQKRLSQENINLPAGIAQQSNTEYTIRADGYFKSVDEISNLVLGVVNNHVIRLSDVASVRDGSQEQRTYTRLNGSPACGVIITKQSDANTVTTAESVLTKLEQVKKLYPELKFKIAYDQSGFIQNSINDLKNTAIIGGLLAVAILALFLRNIRSTMVVALSIPVSIISSFTLFYLGGFTLNTISLSGLALASGLIVDDAVVVLENIFRHIERDKASPAEAAVSATTEITSAVLASTFTIMIVFLPLFLIQGQAGQTFSQFAVVVIVALGISLLDALTVVPMLASRFISREEVEEEAHPELRKVHGKKDTPLSRLFDWTGSLFHALEGKYRQNLNWALNHKLIVIGGGFLTALLVLPLVPLIGSEILPQTDSGNFRVNVKLPVGTSLAVTNAAMEKAESIVIQDPDVDTVFSAAGTDLSLRGSTTAQIGYEGGMTVDLKDDRKLSTEQNIALLNKKLASIPGAKINLQPYDLVTLILSGGSSNFEFDVFGQNYDQLMSSAKKIVEALKSVKGLQAVDIGVQDKTPELDWNVNREKAQTLGISYQDVSDTLDAATDGILSSYYQENGFQYPIYTQLPVANRKSINELSQVPIFPGGTSGGFGKSGTPVLLGTIADPVYTFGPNQIQRLDRQRYVPITGRFVDRPESQVEADAAAVIAKLQLPKGVYADLGIQQKSKGEEFSGLGIAIFLAISLIYMLLATQFESFIYPLVVLTSVPLSVVGVVVALFLTGHAFGLTAFIGMLMLIGIAVKNGILLVDYTNQLRARGLSRLEAILTASPVRLRPILMTSAAAILGMLPLALELGKGSETEAPLAVAVIGGLFTSTVLTLFVVPCVYCVFDDLSRRLSKSNRDLHPTELIPPSESSLITNSAAGSVTFPGPTGENPA